MTSLRHDWALAFGLGLLIEAAPVAAGVLAGRPVGIAFGGIGFVLAWAAFVAVRSAGPAPPRRIADSALLRMTGRLLAFYVIALGYAVLVLVATAFVVGLWFSDMVAGALVLTFTATLLARVAFVVPCLVAGDDLLIAAERSWQLAAAGGIREIMRILVIAAAGLGPAVVAAELTGPAGVSGFAATLLALAAAGPVTMLGLERRRSALEVRAHRLDPTYGHA